MFPKTELNRVDEDLIEDHYVEDVADEATAG